MCRSLHLPGCVLEDSDLAAEAACGAFDGVRGGTPAGGAAADRGKSPDRQGAERDAAGLRSAALASLAAGAEVFASALLAPRAAGRYAPAACAEDSDAAPAPTWSSQKSLASVAARSTAGRMAPAVYMAESEAFATWSSQMSQPAASGKSPETLSAALLSPAVSLLASPSEAREDQCTGELRPSQRSQATTRSHVEMWSTQEETLIMFDWDDTLCPTTYLKQFRLRTEADPAALAAHVKAVQQLLQVAASLGRVSIVSMASPGWIDHTLECYMPQVDVTLKSLDISMSFAQAGAATKRKREACADAREPSHFLKRRTMTKLIREFYASRVCGRPRLGKHTAKGRSWKNILSIGDSDAERCALQDIAMSHTQRDRRGKWKEFRCKTVKLKAFPTLAELTQQVETLTRALPALVHHDGDVDYDVERGDFDSC